MKCCKDCEDRYLGCHSKCEKYAEFKKKHEELKRRARQERMFDDVFCKKRGKR